MSRQPATTLGCPPLPRSGGRDGCTSVVEAERSSIAQRGFADPRADRDVAARLSEGPVPAAQRCGEIDRAAPSEVPGVLSRRHQNAGDEATRRDFIAFSRQAPDNCSGATLTLMRSAQSPAACSQQPRGGGAGLRSRRRSRPLRAVAPRGAGGIRASSPAGETGMSERAGADLPEARDGEGQLSKDVLRAPAPVPH